MDSLAGLRVLVIEDEAAIAMMIETMLEDMGCVVAGSAATVRAASTRIAAGGFDFALLDLNLGDINAEPLADALAKAGKRFAFASGYGKAGVPLHLHDRPVIQKPFTGAELEKLLRDATGAAAAAAGQAAE